MTDSAELIAEAHKRAQRCQDLAAVDPDSDWYHPDVISDFRADAEFYHSAASAIERLAAFKTLVHQRLDALGIPPGEGECRISSRLDCVEAEIERLREALQEALPYVPEHHVPVMHKIRAALGDAP